MASGDFENLEKLFSLMVQKISEGNLDGEKGASQVFSHYLDALSGMGLYQVGTWPLEWRKRHVSLFALFEDRPRQAEPFLNILKTKLQDTIQVEEREAFHFLYLGLIYFTYDDESQSAYEYLQGLLKQYPNNADFRVYHAFCLSQKGSHKLAVNEMMSAMKMANHPEYYVSDLLNLETKYLGSLIEAHEFEAAEKVMSSMQKYYSSYFGGTEWVLLHRQLMLFRSRIEDHRMLSKQFEKVDQVIVEKTERERRRLVEVLGVFAAILTFIFVNVQIAISYSVIEAFWLMLAMGDILLMFAITLSFIFSLSKSKPFFHRTRFWVLVFLAVMLGFVGMGLHYFSGFDEYEVVKVNVSSTSTSQGQDEEQLIENEKVEQYSPVKFRRVRIPKEKAQK